MMNPIPMTSAVLNAASAATTGTQPFGSASTSGAGSGEFAALLGRSVQQASSLETRAQSTVMDLLRGNGVEVHDAMVATQQSELTFELALQVRNKAVAAYQQMMQMQF